MMTLMSQFSEINPMPMESRGEVLRHLFCGQLIRHNRSVQKPSDSEMIWKDIVSTRFRAEIFTVATKR